MSTITIRLPEDLKARVTVAAERAGTTAHSFILEAIAEKTDQVERRADFLGVAEKRYADLAASGKAIPWEKMRRYLEDRIAGKPATRPAAKKLARYEWPGSSWRLGSRMTSIAFSNISPGTLLRILITQSAGGWLRQRLMPGSLRYSKRRAAAELARA